MDGEKDKIMREINELLIKKELSDLIPIDQIINDLNIEENDKLMEVSKPFYVNRTNFKNNKDYIQLKEILVAGFKYAKPNKNGYCYSRPAISAKSQAVFAGSFEFLSSERTVVSSFRYQNYMDSSTIVFREHDQKILLYLPKPGQTAAIMGNGLCGYSLNEQYNNHYNLQYVYLMMKQPQFAKQFPLGLSNSCLLDGYIPKLNKNQQERIAIEARVKSRDILNAGLFILD